MLKVKLDSLRSRWPKELERFSDAELAYEYSYFKESGIGSCDDNDDRFLEWIFMTDG